MFSTTILKIILQFCIVRDKGCCFEYKFLHRKLSQSNYAG